VAPQYEIKGRTPEGKVMLAAVVVEKGGMISETPSGAWLADCIDTPRLQDDIMHAFGDKCHDLDLWLWEGNQQLYPAYLRKVDDL